jgi:hypothetical protein
MAAMFLNADSMLLAPQVQVQQVEHLQGRWYFFFGTIILYSNMIAEMLALICHQIVQERPAKLHMVLDQFLDSSARTTFWLETLLWKTR